MGIRRGSETAIDQTPFDTPWTSDIVVWLKENPDETVLEWSSLQGDWLHWGGPEDYWENLLLQYGNQIQYGYRIPDRTDEGHRGDATPIIEDHLQVRAMPGGRWP